jgi:phage regulator Rha-like protein
MKKGDAFMTEVMIGFVVGYIVLSLVLVPFQYKYIKQLEEMRKINSAKGKTQSDMYEEMEFQHQVLHANAQGNMLFFLANILATIIYKVKNR